jgi:hypothetical protein
MFFNVFFGLIVIERFLCFSNDVLRNEYDELIVVPF